eukprot:jgi/Undpi1/9542/HiC_scaffold_27.g11998.m1
MRLARRRWWVAGAAAAAVGTLVSAAPPRPVSEEDALTRTAVMVRRALGARVRSRIATAPPVEVETATLPPAAARCAAEAAAASSTLLARCVTVTATGGLARLTGSRSLRASPGSSAFDPRSRLERGGIFEAED